MACYPGDIAVPSDSSLPTALRYVRVRNARVDVQRTVIIETRSGSVGVEPGTYADAQAVTEHNRSVEWNHGLGAVVSALVAAGLRVEFLHEHDHTLFAVWPFLEREADGTYRLPKGTPSLPLMYSLLGSKVKA